MVNVLLLKKEFFYRLGVRLGEYRISTDVDCVDHGVNGQDCISNQTIDVGIKSVTIHPNYDRRSYSNDIGLVKLAKDIDFTGIEYLSSFVGLIISPCYGTCFPPFPFNLLFIRH